MTDLELRLAALEDRVTALQRELTRRHGSMAQTRRCPACGFGSLFQFTQVQERKDSGMSELALHHAKGWLHTDSVAPLEAYACRRCRLVEWHARQLDGLVADGVKVVALEAEAEPPPPSDTPFR